MINWFNNAKFRSKFIVAFCVPLSFVVILAIFGIIKITNVENAFESLAEGPNRRLMYASDAISELANCRRCILAMGYVTNDINNIESYYKSYCESERLILDCLNEYYNNLMNDISLHDYEIENREIIITSVKEIFSGPYKENVQNLYNAALTMNYKKIDELVAEGLPMGDEISGTLWTLRAIVQDHLDAITMETKEYTKNAVVLLIIYCVLLIVLSVVVSLLMSNILRVPIIKMEQGMREIAKGNMLYPIRSKYKDELGLLSNQIGDMVDTISVLNQAVAIVDNVDELIFVTDLEHNLIFVNQEAEKLHNVNRSSCIGKKCYKALYGFDEPCEICPLPSILHSKAKFPSIDWERKNNINGEDIYFSCKTSIIQWLDGTFVQICTCKDDTLRKKHEEQQKRHAEELRASALAAKDASRAKSTFLANMSHEIRTPMNAVMGMSELILREKKNLPNDVFENALAIKSASQNLLSVINDILDLSKIESGKLEIIETEYEFASLINDLISIIRIRLVEKPILFSVCIDSVIPASLIGDEIRIRQTLLNILGNAVKYTTEGFVSFSIKGKIDGDCVMLSIVVEDSGIGIKDDYIEKLFGEFIRIDTERNKYVEGTGLGLPISLRLCEAMGGGIEVRSEYGKGSEFTISLPQRFERYTPFAKIDSPEEKSVLLIEPRSLYSDSIAYAFEDLGVSYKTASDISCLRDGSEVFTHIFVGSAAFESVNRELKELINQDEINNPPEVVVLAELTEAAAHKNVRILDLPAYSLSISNLLNNVSGGQFNMSIETESFVAPDASVLIVDDMMSNLLVSKGLMSPYGMNITTCNNGEDAIELVRRNRYDLIFMDHMMPKMDGLEATKHIREMDGEYFATVPIIALTANAVYGVRALFIESGMNDFLAKPIETAKLDAILEKWIPAHKQIIKNVESEGQDESESEFLKELKTIPYLSINKAVAFMGGSYKTYEDIFKLSVRLLPDNVKKLDEFINNSEIKSYEIEIHGVKGVLNNIGVYELGDSAYELEKLAKHGDLNNCLAIHKIFINKLNIFIDAALKLFNGADTLDKLESDKKTFLEVFPQIEEAVESYNATDALEVLNKACEYTYGEVIDDAAEQLTRALEYFDFDEAAIQLSKLKGALEEDE